MCTHVCFCVFQSPDLTSFLVCLQILSAASLLTFTALIPLWLKVCCSTNIAKNLTLHAVNICTLFIGCKILNTSQQWFWFYILQHLQSWSILMHFPVNCPLWQANESTPFSLKCLRDHSKALHKRNVLGFFLFVPPLFYITSPSISPETSFTHCHI